jgi:membrane fusion protein
MENGLFRPEAVKQQSAKLDGEVIIAQPLASKVLLLSLVAVVTIVIIFLVSSSFHRKETVTGYLQPNGGLAKVNVPRTGLIAELFVEDGQAVSAGQPLALINMPEYLSQGDSMSAVLPHSIAQQSEFIVSRKHQMSIQFSQQQQDLEKRIAFAQQSVNDARNQQRLLTNRLTIQQERFDNLTTLSASGAISTNDLQQNQELLLSTQQQLAELNARYQTELAQVEQLSGQLVRLPSERAQQIALINAEQSRLNQQQAEIDARGQILLRAPIDGKVTNLIAKVGTTVKQQMSLATIVPQDSLLKAVLLVPTRAFGFVQPGQQTRIRFDAFPYQRFGLFEGEVIRAASSILTPGEVEMPINIQEPVYRVEVTLGEQEIRAYGNHVPLQPGMTLSADIVLEERNLISWLFEPILSLQGRI